jgi:hypothetical protein
MSGDEFYTNPMLINAFKSLVKTILLRRNTITGILYKDDPSILAIETGNELETFDFKRIPGSWTLDIAKWIKSIDPNHLLIDGSFGVHGWDEEVLKDTQYIDILSNHYYKLPFNYDNFMKYILPSTILVLLAIALAVLLVLVRLKPNRLSLLTGVKSASKSSETTGTQEHMTRDSSEFGRYQPYQPYSHEWMDSTTNNSNTSSISSNFTTVIPEGSVGLKSPHTKRKLTKLQPRQKISIIVLSFLILACLGVSVYLFVNSPFIQSYGTRFKKEIDHIKTATSNSKGFLVGEFAFVDVNEAKELLEAVVDSDAVGGLIWSLRFHSRDGGFCKYPRWLAET